MSQSALIIAHGQPSNPGPAAHATRALAGQIAGHLPGWQVLGVTLAEAGALEAAVAEAGGAGLVYPMFMADGWFTKTHLPQRLSAAGGAGFSQLTPFGLDPAVQDLAAQILRAAGVTTELLLAAHGSFRSPRPAQIADALAAKLAAELGLTRSEAAFIDQNPRLAEVSGFSDQAVCLPFFAAEGGHVVEDLPQALQAAGFGGRVLPPLGLDPRVPGLIAAALLRGSQPG